MVETLKWENNNLYLLDQTLLPHRKEFVKCTTYEEVAEAITKMKVRGAPAIGITAAYGVVLGAIKYDQGDKKVFFEYLNKIGQTLKNTRPTAVNLFWAIEKMLNKAQMYDQKSIDEIKNILLEEAHKMAREDVEINRKIGYWGQQLLKDGDIILTHCNAGALATVGYGTALGVIRGAVKAGKKIEVYADETRPYLQGARLTAWELMESGIPVTLITDNMAGYFMKKGIISGVVVGADRIAANGDVANKIGTYSVAVLAKENKIPFYVAAPTSTFDLSLKKGDEIPIEERNPKEVTHFGGISIAPDKVKVANPAFDITPSCYVTAIITEEGIIKPNYLKNIPKFIKQT